MSFQLLLVILGSKRIGIIRPSALLCKLVVTRHLTDFGSIVSVFPSWEISTLFMQRQTAPLLELSSFYSEESDSAGPFGENVICSREVGEPLNISYSDTTKLVQLQPKPFH